MVSDVYLVSVGGTAVPVWLSRVREAINRPEGAGWTSMLNGPTEWCSFARLDADYPARIDVRVLKPFRSIEVLPRSAGVLPKVEGSLVALHVDRPRLLTVCLDGTDEHPLHLFCREVESNRPDPNDPNVITFGPGEHWVNSVRVRSGQTVYVDGGAILRGVLPEGAQGRRGGVLNLTSYDSPVIDVEGVEDVRICGRGILDGGCLPHPARNLIRVSNSRGVRIEGLTLRNSPNWHLPICASEDVTVEDLACISGRLNSDGVNCVSSSRVTVRRTFVRGHDDCFVVKTTDPGRPATDILYDGCIAWDDWGYAFGVSYETRADIRDVVFRDCDVVFARNWPLGVHVSDSGVVGPILFERIGVYYPRTAIAPHMSRQSVKLDIVEDVWGKDGQRGHIRDITLRDIEINGVDLPPILLAGHNEDHRIEDILFENVRLNGRPLVTLGDHLFRINEHVRNVTVRAT